MIILLHLVLAISFAGVVVSTPTDMNGSRKLVLSCNDDSGCYEVCEGETCEFALASCRNCMTKNNNALEVFLASIGAYWQTGEPVSFLLAREKMMSDKLMIWDSRTIYTTSEFDGFFARNRFASLCPLDSFLQNPLVLDTLDKDHKFSYRNSKLVVCFYENLGMTVSHLKSVY